MIEQTAMTNNWAILTLTSLAHQIAQLEEKHGPELNNHSFKETAVKIQKQLQEYQTGCIDISELMLLTKEIQLVKELLTS